MKAATMQQAFVKMKTSLHPVHQLKPVYKDNKIMFTLQTLHTHKNTHHTHV